MRHLSQSCIAERSVQCESCLNALFCSSMAEKDFFMYWGKDSLPARPAKLSNLRAHSLPGGTENQYLLPFITSI